MLILGQLWRVSFRDYFAPEEGLPALNENEQRLVAEDLAAAKAHVDLELRTKLDWLNRLPWLLIGLAHYDESIARDCAKRAYEAFQSDPREATQHRIS